MSAARRGAVIAPDHANPNTASAVVSPARRARLRNQAAQGAVMRLTPRVCGSICATICRGSAGTRSARMPYRRPMVMIEAATAG